MGVRRKSREFAVQLLYQLDQNPEEKLKSALEYFLLQQTPEPDQPTIDFTIGLVKGALEHREESDAIITRIAENWSLDRISVVDRNILRLAIFEMQHRNDIPPVVSINEAIEIAKKFGTDDSGRFINGILDKLREELLRPARTPAGGNPTATP